MSTPYSLEDFRFDFLRAATFVRRFRHPMHTLQFIDHDFQPMRQTVPYWQLQKVLDMPAVKKGRKNKFANDMEFINYKLDAETRRAFDDWYNSKGNTVVQAIFETLQADNKLSLSYDPDNECYIAAMTGRPESLNPGKCMTLRSADWMKALAAVSYVHTVVFDGEIWEVSGESDLV